jgi:hypothetical protein
VGAFHIQTTRLNNEYSIIHEIYEMLIIYNFIMPSLLFILEIWKNFIYHADELLPSDFSELQVIDNKSLVDSLGIARCIILLSGLIFYFSICSSYVLNFSFLYNCTP